MNKVSIEKQDNIKIKDNNSNFKKVSNSSDKISIFEKILFSLKNKSNNDNTKNKVSLELDKFLKINNTVNSSNKNLIDNFKNLDIKNLDIDINSIDGIDFEIDNPFAVDFKIEKLDKNLNFLSKESKKEKLSLTKDQKTEILHKNLLSRLKIFKNLGEEKVVKEIKEVKNIDDILNITKKYKLNLKRIDIKKEHIHNIDKKKYSSNKELKFKEIKEVYYKKEDHSLHNKLQSLNIESKNTQNTQENDKKSDVTLNVLLQKNSKTKDDKKEVKKDNIKVDLNVKKSDNKTDKSLEILEEKKRVNLNSTKRVVEVEQQTEEKTEKSDKIDLTANEKIDSAETKRVSGFEDIVKPNETIKQKIIDAKQTVLSFAKTLQEQVENYKPPFTRMQLSLDPEDLGKVDVTLITRGKNLHIQVNSNPTAIGVMAVQGNELRNQLNSMGFTDVQMQFNMNQQQQQQQQNNKRQTYLSKEYIDVDEIPQDYESLEIVLPNYA